MAYLALVIIPVFIVIGAVLSPTARQEVVNVAHVSIDRTANAIEQLRQDPNITKRINGIQRRIAAYLLRQAADSVEKK